MYRPQTPALRTNTHRLVVRSGLSAMYRGFKPCAVVLLACTSTVACSRHVELKPPRPSATFEERVAFHEDHQPRLTKETHVTTFQGTNPTATSRQTDYLLLNDGRRIYYPEDLSPIVPDDSRTAAAIERWSRARSTRHTLTGLGLAGVAGGTALSLVGIGENAELGSTFYIGMGVFAVSLLVVSAWAPSLVQEENDEAATAYEFYGESLRAGLELCVEGDEIVECE
ncbi:MAG: hypothetical protein AAGJ56_10095 [Myxococcota bacterium]